MIYLTLFLTTFIPISVALGFYFIERFTKFSNLKPIYRQLIIGVVFGLVAIVCTELGYHGKNYSVAISDSAPLLAGLLFGGPAGIIAGCIGAVESIISSVNFGYTITQWANFTALLLAGVFSFLLRKFMFENKRPSWGFAIAVTIVMEVINSSLVFLTNIRSPQEPMEVIKYTALPLILWTVFTVFVSTLVIQLVTVGKKTKEVNKDGEKALPKISTQVQWWLLGSIVVTYLLSSSIIFAVQTSSAYQEADTNFVLTMSDVYQDVNDSSNSYLLGVLNTVVERYNEDPFDPNNREKYEARFRELMVGEDGEYQIASVDLIKYDPEGTFACSSLEGFDYNSFKMTWADQSAEIHSKMNTIDSKSGKVLPFVQAFQKQGDSSDDLWKKYAAAYINEDYYLAISIGSKFFYQFTNEKIKDITSYRHVKSTGYILITQYDGTIISDVSRFGDKECGLDTTKLPELGEDQLYSSRQRAVIYGEDSFFMYTRAETYTIAIVLPYDEVLSDRDNSFIINSYMEIFVFAVLYTLIYLLLRAHVVKKIEKINDSLGEIIEGDLNLKVNVKSSHEFASLSDDINKTVDSLKKYIDEAEKRIEEELIFAKTIQASSLPSVFPAFPDKPQFDLYATMNPAKEVGGDFYDFYIINENKLAFLIADVSGKGIPAAMFMMESKATLKNLAKTLQSPDEVLTKTNESLSQNNEANMFVTCWFGILDFSTGHVTFANAGHNTPIIYKNGKWEYLKQKKQMVLAAVEGVNYSLQEFDLLPGDRFYLYTDGVTEATRTDKVLYGEERLVNYLNDNKSLSLKDALNGIKDNIDIFIEGADQFDDMTMLCIEYKGNK